MPFAAQSYSLPESDSKFLDLTGNERDNFQQLRSNELAMWVKDVEAASLLDVGSLPSYD